MKKKFLTVILSLIAVMCLCISISACGGKSVTYRLNFIVDEEVYATIETTGNEVISIPAAPQKEGYTFDGWFFDKDVWSQQLSADSLVSSPITQNTSVYAKFTKNTIPGEPDPVTEYTLTFVVDGATYHTLTTAGNVTIVLPAAPQKEGYTFDGWFFDKDVWSQQLSADSLVSSPITQNTSVYAKFTPITVIPKYNIYFIVDDYTYHTINTSGKEVIVLPKNPTKEGYVFDGWYWDRNVWSYEFTENSVLNQQLTADVYVYAYFVSNNISDGSLGLSYSFNKDEGGYIVTGIGACVDSEVIIPTMYNNYPVVGIADSAFAGCFRISKITVQHSVTFIGNKAFYNCINLTSLDLPDSIDRIGTDVLKNTPIVEDDTYWSEEVLYIDNYLIKVRENLIGPYSIKNGTVAVLDNAFENCSLLTEIYIPDTVTYLGKYAFRNCTNLGTVDLSNSIDCINTSTFASCENLKSIEIPSSVTSIGSNAFYNCANLTDVVIPDTVAEISSSAFSNCANIKYEIVDEHLKYLGNWLFGVTDNTITSATLKNTTIAIFYRAFYGCDSLTSVSMPDSVKTIGDYAFYSCDALSEVALSQNLLSIGECAFDSCKNLTSITIPKSVIDIGNDAFDACDRLSAVYYSGSIKDWCNIYFDHNDANPLRNNAALYVGGSIVSELIIPNGVIEIQDYAFSGCTSITKIILPNSVTRIGYQAFGDCYNLTEVIMPNNLVEIDSYAFSQCKALMSIAIPQSVQTINSNAFYGCEKLIAVRNYSSLEIVAGESDYGYVGYYADTVFTSADMDREIFFTVGDFIFYENRNGEYFLVGYTGDSTSVVLPDTVNEEFYSIYSSAFSGSSHVTSITVPQTVLSIQYGAFYGCENLESITLPFIGESSRELNEANQYPFGFIFGETSFNNAVSTKQYYRNSTSSSTTYDYYYIPASLKTVTITGSIINYGAFYNCSNIENIYISNAKTIDGSTFYNCSNLKFVALPSDLEKIPDSIFSYCTSLDSISVPAGAVEVGSYAFRGCSALKDISFGIKIKVIGDWAFEDCVTLISISLPANLETIEDGLFDGCSNLTTISMPTNLKYINHYAFRDCTSLTMLDIPNTVISIGSDVFKNTPIYTDDNNWTGDVLYIGGCLIEAKTELSGRYTVDEGTTFISSYAFYNCSGITEIVLPDTIIAIGDYAFYGCSGLTTIESEARISHLGDYAFYGCVKLVSINIIGDITSIGSYAFYNCSSLTSITIPETVISIGNCAFYNCSALVELNYNAIECADWTSSNNVFYKAGQSGNGIAVTIGNKVNHIPAYLFYSSSNSSYAPKIATVVFEADSSCTDIGKYAFAYCSLVQNINIPASMECISAYAFYNCTGLTLVQYEGTGITVSETAFAGCTFDPAEFNEYYQNGIYNGDIFIGFIDDAVTSIDIREGTTEIAAEALLGYTNLTSVTLPKSLLKIGSKAFHNCVNIEMVNYLGTLDDWCNIVFVSDTSNPICYAKQLHVNGMPVSSINLTKNIAKINSYAFIGFENIDGVYYEGSLSDWCKIEFGNETANPLNCAYNLYINNRLISELIIPDDVTKINAYAFIGLKNVENIVVPNSVTSIGNAAFRNIAIKSISMPYTGELRCFDIITGANTKYVLPETMESITFTSGTISKISGGWGQPNMSGTSYWTNYPNTTLKEVILTGDVKAVESGAFSSMSIEILTLGCIIESVSSYSFPETVTKVCITSLEDWCRSAVGNTGILAHADLYLDGELVTEPVIPNSVETIRAGAFRNYIKLTKVTISEGIVSIGDSAFYGCSGLKSMVLPSTVTTIGDSSFSSCENLTDFSVTENLKRIDSNAFASTPIEKFYYVGDFGKWCNVSFASPVSNPLTGAALYINGTLTKELVIPEGVETIGNDVFRGCSSLISVIVPNSVVTIGSSAFYNCSGLRTVVLGNGVRSISSSAFSGCSSISTVYYIGDIEGWSEIELGSSASPLQYNAALYCNGYLIEDTLVIPYGTTEISDYAFANNRLITKVIIPDTVRTIGVGAFKNCINLSEIVLPDQVKIIEAEAFYNTAFYNNSANWIDGVLYIGNTLVRVDTSASGIINVRTNTYWIAEDAFKNCSSITEVKIPLSVRYIPSKVFFGCGSLATLTLPYCDILGNLFGTTSFSGATKVETSSYYTNYYIPASLRSITVLGGTISDNAFYNCSMLTSITLKDDVYAVGNYAFYKCTGLKSMAIPDRVTTLSYNTFYGCSNLQTITLGRSISSLSSGFYYDCAALTAIYFRGDLEDYCNISLGSAFDSTIDIYVSGQKLVNVIIPNTVDSISAYAFMNNTAIQSVVIPSSVKTIGDYAFANCPNLSSITIDNGVQIIESHTFNNCTSLKRIEFGDSIETIGKGALSGCSALQELTYGTEDILGMLFGTASYDNSTAIVVSKTTYYIPNSLTAVTFNGVVLPAYAFYKCINLKKIIITNNLASMGNYSIGYCTGLEYLGLPRTIEQFNNGYASPFYGCNTLNIHYEGTAEQWFKSEIATMTYGYNLYIDNELVTTYTVSNITDSMFANCKSLQTVNIAEGVTTIGKRAFANCTGITSITLPNSIMSIDENAFTDCSNLAAIYFNGTVADWCKINFVNSASNPLSVCKNLFFNNDPVTDLVVPDDVTTIGQFAFYNGAFTSVTIGSSITEMGQYAFYGCSSLTKVLYNAESSKWLDITFINQYSNPLYYAHDLYINNNLVTEIEIPAGAIEVGQYVFSYCTKLQKITIPEGIEVIGSYAFSGCAALTDIVLPSTIKTIKDNAFSGCNSLSAVYFNGVISDWVNIDFSSSSANPLYYGHNLYVNSELVTNVKVEGITEVKPYVFYGCTSIESIAFAEGITAVNSSAFYGCASIKSLTFAEGVTLIDDYAFYGCTSLSTVNLPGSLTKVGSSAFSNCPAITRVNYFGELKTWCLIEFENGSANPIYYAHNLYIDDAAVLTGTLELPEDITVIGQYAFVNATNLNSIIVKNTDALTRYSAFYGCSGLTSVDIPLNFPDESYSNTKRFSYVFGGSIPQNLTSVRISGGTVNKEVFYDASAITTITIADTILSFGNDAFRGCSNLVDVYYEGELVDWLKITFANEAANPVYFAHNLYINNELLTELDIPSTVGSIKANAFTGASCITSITIPNTVTSIGTHAFAGTNVTSIEIPYSAATGISEGILAGCSKLIELKCPVVHGNSGSGFWPERYNAIGYYFGTAEYESSTAIKQFYRGPYSNGGASSFGHVEATYYFPNTLTNITINGGMVGYGAFSNITLPINVTLENVTDIYYAAFYNCRGMQTLTLNEGLDEIYNTAFYNCTGLKTLTIPGTAHIDSNGSSTNYLKYAGSPAFYGCQNIETIILADGYSRISSECFEGCTGLKNITIPRSVIYVGVNAFTGCKALENVYYGGDTIEWCLIEFDAYWSYYGKYYSETNPMSFADNLFIKGKLLTDLVIPNNIESIGDYQFYGISSIESVTISGDVKSFGASAFGGEAMNIKSVIYNGTLEQWLNIEFKTADANPTYWSENLYIGGELVTDIVVPDSIDKVNAYAFYNLKSLNALTINDNVTSIGAYAFNNTGLTHVIIGKKVESISSYAFRYCYKLVDIFNKSDLEITTKSQNNGFVGYYAKNIYTLAEGESKLFTDQDGYVFYIDETQSLYYLIAYKGSEKNICLPDAVNGHDYAIYDYAFCGHSDLNSVVIPDSVYNIGAAIFSGCTHLTRITIPYMGESINSLLPIGYLFGSQNYVGTYEARQEYYRTSSGTSTTYATYYIPKSLISVTISTGNINYGAFYNCGYIKTITIENPVAEINTGAFRGASGLQSIVVSDDHTKYSSYSGILYNKERTEFVYIPLGLTGKLELPNSITSIPSSAFSGRPLTEVVIGENIVNIGSDAFRNCTLLEAIYFNATAMNDLTSSDGVFYNAGQNGVGIQVIIGKNVTKLPAYLFYAYTAPKIVSVRFEGDSTCVSIGKNAFYRCQTLTSVSLPNSLKSIEGSAFYGCTGIVSITIPSEVNFIGPSAFYGCTNLNNAIFENTSGWWRASSSTATSGTSIAVTSASDAATYLKSTYSMYYWHRG